MKTLLTVAAVLVASSAFAQTQSGYSHRPAPPPVVDNPYYALPYAGQPYAPAYGTPPPPSTIQPSVPYAPSWTPPPAPLAHLPRYEAPAPVSVPAYRSPATPSSTIYTAPSGRTQTCFSTVIGPTVYRDCY